MLDLQKGISVLNIHDATNHSYKSVRKSAFFLDWRTQPKAFKNYPHFYLRYKISDYPALENLNLIGGITFEKEYPEGKYYLRTVPSAGALYPFELYLQLRGINGLPNGIYHYEPLKATLTLLHEIESDGIEHYFPNPKRRSGIEFLVSAVYFRSSWKYRDRALRYIFLDNGHQLGAIYAALTVMGKESIIDLDFDKAALNKKFGFIEGEMFTASLHSSSETEKEAKAIPLNLPFVCASDYLEPNNFIKEAYEQSVDYTDTPFTPPQLFLNIPKEQLREAIINRRSIRAFRGERISKESFTFIIQDLFEFANSHNIDIFYTLHRVEDTTEGLYKNAQLLKEGDFKEKSRYLSLEQNLGGESAATLYFTSSDLEKYQKASILSGFIAHIIYLRCQLQAIGCSGIGAYYDEEAKSFLNTDNNILYLLAIGK
ncbi:MAG TPA: SagB/ThcOx family dehydrogenase [Nitratifractor sp.]|nr:SagB/ThcOx family dehydrogenase [Nitratifractor sp.]